MVENHVEHHLEAGGVQGVDRLGELVGRGGTRPSAPVARLGREPGRGRVAPVVGEAAPLQRRLVGAEVQRQQAQRGDAERAVVLEHHRVGEGRIAAAQRRREVRVAHRQRAHVGLVEHRAIARDTGAGRASGRRHGDGHACLGDRHACLGGEGGVVAQVGQARIVVAGGAELGQPRRLLRVVGCARPLATVAADHLLRPGVEQQLGRVEPVPALRRPRPVGAQAIHQAGPGGGQEAVPDALAAGRQPQAMAFLAAGGIEEAELDRFGVRRPHGEIYPALAGVLGLAGAERPRLSGTQGRGALRACRGDAIRSPGGTIRGRAGARAARVGPVAAGREGVGERGAHRGDLVGRASRRVNPRARTSPRPAAAGAAPSIAPRPARAPTRLAACRW